MFLQKICIKNFRATRDVELECGSLTAILGANGAGKSTILRALDLFYSPSFNVTADDFFGRNSEEPIEIALTFASFSDDEHDRFGDRIHNGEMTVVRVFEGEGRQNGRYYGIAQRHPAFQGIRAITGAAEKRRAFAEFRQAHPEYGFAAVQRADDIEEQFLDWERAHLEKCELVRDDGQFLGFANVGRGNLKKSTSFLLIPAVRDASADAMDARGAVIGRLMELLVRTSIQNREEIRSFQQRISTEYAEIIDPNRLPELRELSSSLTETLQAFYSDAGVQIAWSKTDEITVPLPKAEVKLEENGFEGPVDRKGHGLQRAFILSLLQQLARATASIENRAEDSEERDGAAGPHLPGLILAIEEPELYQHPTKQRHFANVLTQLSDGQIAGVAAQTQIIYATHSPLFVSMNRFDNIRLARKWEDPDSGDKECRIVFSTLDSVAGRLELAYGQPVGSFSGDVLRGRLHIIGPELAEGFFAELVVLVEGESDRAAILAAAALAGISLEANGIAVLPVGGKGKLDKPLAIFRELGIPTYVIWDCDLKQNGIEGVEYNRALQRLCGCQEPYDAATHVAESYASFETNLEAVLKQEIGAEVYEEQLEAITQEFGLNNRKDAIKAPHAMTKLLSGADNKGYRCDTLAAIVRSILVRAGVVFG